MGHYVYRYVDNDTGEILYVGKNDTNLINRINQHKGELRFQGLNAHVEYIELSSKTDTAMYEIYYINMYKPPLNKATKYEDVATFQIPDCKWIICDENVNVPIKHNRKNTNKKEKRQTQKIYDEITVVREGIARYSTVEFYEEHNDISAFMFFSPQSFLYYINTLLNTNEMKRSWLQNNYIAYYLWFYQDNSIIQLQKRSVESMYDRLYGLQKSTPEKAIELPLCDIRCQEILPLLFLWYLKDNNNKSLLYKKNTDKSPISDIIRGINQSAGTKFDTRVWVKDRSALLPANNKIILHMDMNIQLNSEIEWLEN